jgi:hypothetical protein
MYIGMLGAVEKAPRLIPHATRRTHSLTPLAADCLVGKKYEKSIHTGAAPHPRAQTPSFYVATDLKELL